MTTTYRMKHTVPVLGGLHSRNTTCQYFANRDINLKFRYYGSHYVRMLYNTVTRIYIECRSMISVIALLQWTKATGVYGAGGFWSPWS